PATETSLAQESSCATKWSKGSECRKLSSHRPIVFVPSEDLPEKRNLGFVSYTRRSLSTLPSRRNRLVALHALSCATSNLSVGTPGSSCESDRERERERS